MATIIHPGTGVILNVISILRPGRLNERELRAAESMLTDGDPRWLVAARLGCFPLEFNGQGRRPEQRRPSIGGYLSARDAMRDPRQMPLIDLPGGTDPADV